MGASSVERSVVAGAQLRRESGASSLQRSVVAGAALQRLKRSGERSDAPSFSLEQCAERRSKNSRFTVTLGLDDLASVQSAPLRCDTLFQLQTSSYLCYSPLKYEKSWNFYLRTTVVAHAFWISTNHRNIVRGATKVNQDKLVSIRPSKRSGPRSID